MTLRSITHHLTCPECAAALGGTPGPHGEDRCAIVLDEDQDPPVRCPHRKAGGSDWCEIHGEAIAEQRKADDEADELAERIAELKRRIATARMGLRAFDRSLTALRSQGVPAAEIARLKIQREEAGAALEREVAGKAALEARLAVLRPPGNQEEP